MRPRIAPKELIELGIRKRNEELDIEWDELGRQYNLTGEQVRQAVKYYCKNNGTLKGKYESGRLKILIFSDLHIPDHQEEMILNIIKENSKVDLIILAGDIIDCKAVSAWYNEEISILDHEMIEAHRLLNKIRKITKAKIILVKGNHEQRVNVHYAKNAKAMGTAVVETEILYKLANGFSVKFHASRTRVEYEAIPDVEFCEARTYVIGDLLVNHPSIFRKDHLKTVSIMWQEKLKTKYPHVRVVAIGHTHQIGMAFSEDGRVLIETGCTCHPAGYADQDDRPFKLQQYGYVYLEMKDDKVDIDSIKIKYLGHDEVQNQKEYDDITEY